MSVTTKSFGVSLDTALVDKLTKLASRLSCSRSALIGALLNDAINPQQTDVVTVLQNPEESAPHYRGFRDRQGKA